MKITRTAKLLAYLAGALLIAVLIARLPVRSLLPEVGALPGLLAKPSPSVHGTPPARPPKPGVPTPTPSDPKVRAALKEGKVVWWYSFDETVGRRVLEAFRAHYPQIAVNEHLGLPPAQLYPRLLAELRAGTAAVDVLTLTDVELAYDLQQRGLWAGYISPQASGIADHYKSQPPGQWTVIDIDPMGVVWNSRAITGGVPITGYWSLVSPVWKGQLGIAESPGESQLAAWYGLSTALGQGYWDQIAKNQPRVFTSPEAMLVQVATGNPAVALNAPWSVARRYLRPGGDLRLLLPPEGMPARFSASGLLAKAPRPNAGKVFLDFLLSAEGQRLLGPTLRGTYSPRRDVNGPEGLPPVTGFTLLRPSSWEDYARVGRDFPALWERTFGVLR